MAFLVRENNEHGTGIQHLDAKYVAPDDIWGRLDVEGVPVGLQEMVLHRARGRPCKGLGLTLTLSHSVVLLFVFH